MTKEDVFDKNEELTTISLEQLRLRVNNELTSEKVTEDFKRLFGDRVLGVVSPDSTAAFCNKCFQDFASWIQNMMCRGNYEIRKIIRLQMIKQSLDAERKIDENRI